MKNNIIRLRPYKSDDGNYILDWIKDERAFTQWCMNKFTYPLTKEQLDEYDHRFDKDNNAWLMTAINGTGNPVGHFQMRLADYENECIHLGFIIVDSNVRGKGYGKLMVGLAVKYAFEILKVNRVTLGVFDCNQAAHHCYQSVGLKDECFKENAFTYQNERWGIYEMAIECNNTETE